MLLHGDRVGRVEMGRERKEWDNVKIWGVRSYMSEK